MVKWKIVDEKEAKKLHIELTHGGILRINLKHIPPYMTIEKFIRYIEENGIAFCYKN